MLLSVATDPKTCLIPVAALTAPNPRLAGP